jgi:chromate reductase, NAD(P)H dehydrogenase (quinone)
MGGMRLLALSGSLRTGSANIRLLEAVRLLAPPTVNLAIRPPLDDLPYFNPDVEEAGLPPGPAALRAAVGSCDALLVSCPEYAHGVPGVMKNALDWLVGGMEMNGKPAALLNATPPGEYAQAALMETLRVLGGHFVEAASIEVPLRGSIASPEEIAADPGTAKKITHMFDVLARYVK